MKKMSKWLMTAAAALAIGFSGSYVAYATLSAPQETAPVAPIERSAAVEAPAVEQPANTSDVAENCKTRCKKAKRTHCPYSAGK